MYKVIVFSLLLSTSVFALPLLGGSDSGEGNVSPSPSGNGEDCAVLSGLLDGQLGTLFKIIPLNADLDGAVGEVVSLVRLAVEKVIIILHRLLPTLSTKQLEELAKLFANENMTKSEILQELDRYIDGQPIKLQKLYKQIVQDVEGKADATFETLTKIGNNVSPQVGELIQKLGDLVQDDVLTLLEEDEAIGKLVSELLGDVDKLLKDLLRDVDQVLCELLKALNIDELLNLNGVIRLDAILGGLLGKGGNGLLGNLGNTVDKLLGGNGDGLLNGNDDGLLNVVSGGSKGDKGGLLGTGLLGGGDKGGLLSSLPIVGGGDNGGLLSSLPIVGGSGKGKGGLLGL